MNDYKPDNVSQGGEIIHSYTDYVNRKVWLKVTHIMRVLIVTRYFWPEDGVAEEPLMLRLCKVAYKKGHNVEVVTGARKRPT